MSLESELDEREARLAMVDAEIAFCETLIAVMEEHDVQTAGEAIAFLAERAA